MYAYFVETTCTWWRSMELLQVIH